MDHSGIIFKIYSIKGNRFFTQIENEVDNQQPPVGYQSFPMI